MSIVRSHNQSDKWKKITYQVFDVPHLKEPFEKRMQHLKALAAKINSPFLSAINQIKLTGEKHLASELKRIVDSGGEGVMFETPYQNGRSSALSCKMVGNYCNWLQNTSAALILQRFGASTEIGNQDEKTYGVAPLLLIFTLC